MSEAEMDKMPQPTEEELVDYFWRLTTQLQGMTDRLLLQREKTECICAGTAPFSDAYSLAALTI